MNINPTYFEKFGDEGLTPSNTPSNKIKEKITYNLNMDFTGKFKQEPTENEDREIQDMIEYCKTFLIGKLQHGHNNGVGEQKGCSKLYCNRCTSKVNIISGYAVRKDIKQNDPSVMKDCLDKNSNVITYACKCCTKSIEDDLPINVKDAGLDWECDGHVVKQHK